MTDALRQPTMQLHGHYFNDFKSVEQICWTCGYVVPRGMNAKEAESFMLGMEGSNKIGCGGKWHNLRPVE